MRARPRESSARHSARRFSGLLRWNFPMRSFELRSLPLVVAELCARCRPGATTTRRMLDGAALGKPGVR